jgi:diguanylate cyclase (GGDEF)-like protein/PAS domain S-box-containing protein
MKLPLHLPNTLFTRMAFAFTGLFTAATFFITWSITAETARSQLDLHQRLGENLIELTRPAIQRMLIEYDVAELKNYMASVTGDPGIAQISITDDQNITLYEFSGDFDQASWITRLLTTGTDEPRRLSTDFVIAGKRWGTMDIVLSYKPLNSKVLSSLINSLVLSAAILIITLVLTYLMLARFTRPLRPLTEIARQYARGNWLKNVAMISSGTQEIQELTKAFVEGSTTMQHYIHSLEETRELLEQSESRLRTLINSMHEVLFELDAEGHISFINPSWQTITGFTIDESLGRNFSDYLVDEGAKIFAKSNLHKIRERNREILLKTASGDPVWVTLDAATQFDNNGDFTGIIGTLGDITETVELNRMLSTYQEELYHLSVTDPLTKLYNRRHFDTQFDIILSDHQKGNKPLCLLLIDIDGFKFINDTYGHPFGDEVLKHIATLLQQLVRRNDYIARLAGDEFAMVLKNTGIQDATRIAYKLHDNINQAQIQLPVGHIQIQCSIGVAEAPTHGDSAQALISAADVALYQSKRAGRNRVQVLSEDISKATMSIFGQGFQIRNALESGNIRPAFQPILNLENRNPVAYEVLARMQLDGEIIPAKDFITVAEELGLTREVDLYMIEQALILAPRDHSLFVNVDLSSFNDESFIRRLRDLIRPACESGRQITIEVTERESVPITEDLINDINDMRESGCKLALDDFGSGYSTYKFLELFKPDYLKIEGTFVQSILDSESSSRIVNHIHELARSFGMDTIAENIESEAILKAVRSIGIRNGQGIYLGEPELLQPPQ